MYTGEMTIVVVGDKAKITEQLAPFAPPAAQLDKRPIPPGRGKFPLLRQGDFLGGAYPAC